MTPDQWLRARALFEAAVDRDSRDVDAFVAREAADDAAVRDEVLSLLHHHSHAGAFLTEPIAERAADLLAEDDPGLAGGATLGAYVIERELGRGGMGRVYLARDSRLGRRVAVKALAPALTRDPIQRERLRREARAAAALSHPGICTVHALEEIDGDLFIVSEFVDGETLGQEIRAGRRPLPQELVATARALASALADAHAAGIVHRDLKPDNVMRARDGRLKILDFGLARSTAYQDPGLGGAGAGPLTRPGLIVGTPAYMAPEQINGAGADARSDVFAFGVLLYEYASGLHPFAAATPLATAGRVLHSDVAPIVRQCPEMPPALAGIIARCLSKAPVDRFATASELVGAIETLAWGDRASGSRPLWWQVHQLAIVALYAVGAVLAWQLKEWIETPATVAIFVALGAAATIGSVLRGHLVFTERMHPAQLAVERRRAARPAVLVDVVAAALLVADGVIVSSRRALPGVFAVSLGLGIALAALVLEPATTRAAFGGGE